MVRRLGELGFVIFLSFGVAYLVFGLKVDRLTAQVRSLRQAVATASGQGTAFGSESGAGDEAIQTRLQEQLEACLFEKARLSKQAGNVREPELLPRTGSAPFQEYATSPLSPQSD